MIRVACLFMALVACSKSPDAPVPSPAPVPPPSTPPVVHAGDGPMSPAPAPTPPAKLSPIESGRALFGKYCALCHGPEAKGYMADNAPSLVTSTFIATASDAYLRAGIERGRPGTAMGAYGRASGGPLSTGQVNDIMAFVRNGAPAPAEPAAAPTGGNAKRGAATYAKACQSCHGDVANRGKAVHLANPVFLETASDAFIAAAIRDGRPGSEMIAFATTLTDAQIADVIAHIRSWGRPIAGPDKVTVAGEGPVVINPKGKAPTFKLKDDRFVAGKDVLAALKAKQKMIIVDARTPADYARGHIPGAIFVPYYKPEEISKIPNDDTWVLAYCACPHHASGIVVDELRKRGQKRTAVIDEGIVWWEKQGFPMEALPAGVLPKGHESDDPHAGHNHGPATGDPHAGHGH